MAHMAIYPLQQIQTRCPKTSYLNFAHVPLPSWSSSFSILSEFHIPSRQEKEALFTLFQNFTAYSPTEIQPRNGISASEIPMENHEIQPQKNSGPSVGEFDLELLELLLALRVGLWLRLSSGAGGASGGSRGSRCARSARITATGFSGPGPSRAPTEGPSWARSRSMGSSQSMVRNATFNSPNGYYMVIHLSLTNHHQLTIIYHYPYGCVWKCCVPLNPMVLLIIIPFLNGYFIGNINPTFSDKPIWLL